MNVVWTLSFSAIGMPCSGPRILPGRALAIALVGELERLRVHGDGGVQQLLVHPDALQVLADDLARRDAPRLQRRLHLGNRRLDDREWLVSGRRRSGGGLFRLGGERRDQRRDSDGDGSGCDETFHPAIIIDYDDQRR